MSLWKVTESTRHGLYSLMPQCFVNDKQKRQMKRFNFYTYLQYCWYRTSRCRFCLEKLYILECKSRKIEHALNNHLPYILEETKKIIIYHFAQAWAGIHTDNELQVKLIVISEIRLKKKKKIVLECLSPAMKTERNKRSE